jgi:hypothetical protein
MSVSDTMVRRRVGVAVNYILLFLVLAIGIEGYWLGWSMATKIGFWLAVILVITTFVPVHVRTGLWRLAHARVDKLDEREIQQTLRSLRHAYVIFSIIALLIILSLVFVDLGGRTEQLIVFWVLLYLAHTLPSSILAWTSPRVPAQAEE